MRVLLIGPDPAYSKGGMASVIETIRDDKQLNMDFEIDVYGSCLQGNIVKRLTFSVYAYLKFCLTKGDYDIYHIHTASRGSIFRKGLYVWTAKKWGKKVILHIHASIFIDYFETLSKRRKKIILNILKMSDKVIALSEGWKEKFDSRFDLNNCVVLRNCVDIYSLEPAVSDHILYSHSFIMLSRMCHDKGTYDLVDAVETVKDRISDIKVYLAGDGEVDQVKNLVFEKGLEDWIDVIGWADFSKRIALLKEVATVVLPSYHEGLPMAILEGMACGKAIISTTVGAIPEVVKEENGILIQPGDVSALVDALVECATNTDRMKHMSACNIDRINREFSMQYMREELNKCYNSLL